MLRVFLNNVQQWHFPPDASAPIPDKLKTATLHFEDRWFYWHLGVNPVSIIRAVRQNVRGGEIVSGASTITMQVARMIRPKQRNYLNKILEMLQAVKIEIKYSKDEILRLYLDHAPYGGNIIGYQAAAMRYFRKTADELTWGETATLAVLPNAPGLISPVSDPSKLKVKRDRLLKNLLLAGKIDRQTFELACLEEIPQQSFSIAMCAAHAAQWLKEQHPQKGVIQTTIDKSLQMQIESLLKNHADQLKSLGIQNAAALVVETQSGKVRAYIGSQDFDDRGTNGQVDGVRALRSSGSILKPFLYALSIDEGLILPATLINDVPTYFGAFSPANADETYSGVVRARDALTRSLNVPAARLLNKFGLHCFYHFLKEAGLTGLFRAADDYGLPLILGGAEVSLWEMTALFRGLANGGRFGGIAIAEWGMGNGGERGAESEGRRFDFAQRPNITSSLSGVEVSGERRASLRLRSATEYHKHTERSRSERSRSERIRSEYGSGRGEAFPAIYWIESTLLTGMLRPEIGNDDYVRISCGTSRFRDANPENEQEQERDPLSLASAFSFASKHEQENEQEQEKSKQLISPAAAYLTLEILQEVKRPGSEFYWRQYDNQFPFAWKTGTSYGQRDAWAIGVSPQWTIAVWVGNFSGQGNANLSGNSCAGPLLFDIFNFLPKDGAQRWFSKPREDFVPRKICRQTGFTTGEDCPDPVWLETPKTMKPLALCSYHKRIFVSSNEKEQVCSLCWQEDEYKSTVKLIFPPDVAQLLRRNGQITESLPPHRASCSGLAQAPPVKIIYPLPNASLWIPRDFDGNLQKVNLRAVHQKKNQTVYWYLDSHYQGSSKERHEQAVALSKGWHELEVVDEDGNSDRVKFFANLKGNL